jgi:hypothetical protein
MSHPWNLHAYFQKKLGLFSEFSSNFPTPIFYLFLIDSADYGFYHSFWSCALTFRIFNYFSYTYLRSINAACQLTNIFLESNDGPVDYGFYHTFWSLHAYFQNFQILFLHPDKWPTFVKGVELVLAAFAGNSNLEDVVQQQNHYFTKYLTSSNLIKLQV